MFRNWGDNTQETRHLRTGFTYSGRKASRRNGDGEAVPSPASGEAEGLARSRRMAVATISRSAYTASSSPFGRVPTNLVCGHAADSCR